METKYKELINIIGFEYLLSLPKSKKEELKSTTNIEDKIKLLEEIAANM